MSKVTIYGTDQGMVAFAGTVVVDFNERSNNMLLAPLQWQDHIPEVGTQVLLKDHEDMHAIGIVRQVEIYDYDKVYNANGGTSSWRYVRGTVLVYINWEEAMRGDRFWKNFNQIHV